MYKFYKNYLLDTISFWEKYSIDKKYGGYFTCLDRMGRVYNTAKYAWLQGRQIWMFSKLYNEFEKREKWIKIAEKGVSFLLKHFFDKDGRIYFKVSREGRPLHKPKKIYSEVFAVIGLSEYAKAVNDTKLMNFAKELYWKIIKWKNIPEMFSRNVYPVKGVSTLAIPMVILNITQEMREKVPDIRYKSIVDNCINEIYQHIKPEYKAVFENIKNGKVFFDIPEGRLINPGHVIEAGWFLLHEGMFNNNNDLINQALKIIEWSLNIGWDKKYGGILYFIDFKGLPTEQLEWDMKLWWVHSEAIYATLLAYKLTDDKKFKDWHKKIFDWSFKHFADKKYGEWYGYLHRDGSISLDLKGGIWKGCFHLPRALFYCMNLFKKSKST